MDLAKLQGGSGIIRYRGLELESKDGITVKAELETMDVAIDGISKKADQRVTAHVFTITITPTGKWINPDRLYPYITWPLGRLVLPVLPVSINTGTDVITSTNHLFYTGDRVMLGIRAGGTLPTSAPQVTEDDWYFVRVISANTYTLHSTRADANSNTAPINFAAAGAEVVVIGQFDLEIIGEDGERVTFHAVAIDKQPDMNLTRKETPFGSIELKGYVRNRKKPADVDAFYSKDTPGWPGWLANASDIKTESVYVAWANQLKTTGVVVADNELTIADHGLADGTAVYIGSTGTLPVANPVLDPETKYFVKAAGVGAVTLHPTNADALAGTNEIDITAIGSGDLFLTVENATFTLMDTEAGVQLTFGSEINERESDRHGAYNGRLSDCSVEAKFIALSLGMMQILGMLKLQGPGASLGRSLSANSRQLNMFAPGMHVRVNGAAPKSGDLNWSMEDDRARELNFVNTRVVTAGVLQPVATVGSQIP